MSLSQSQNFNEDPNYINQNEQRNTINQPYPIQTPQRRNRAYPSSAKIKWRDIMKIDLEMIARTNDLSVLEYYLENIVYSDITEDEIQSVPEGNIVKLIKVCQFTIEYLLSSQQKLEANCRNLESQNNQLNIDNMNKEAQLKDNKDQIRTLRKEKKHTESVLLTYKNVIENNHHKRLNKHPSVYISQSESIDESKQRFYCKYCKGKKYSTEELLNNHLHKRHLIEMPSSQKIEVRDNKGNEQQLMVFEKKLEEMKTHFEVYFRKFQEETSMKQLEHQKKIEEDKQSKQLVDMGNTFKNTLNELKDFYLQNTIKNNQQQIHVATMPVAPSQEQIQMMPLPVNNQNDQMTQMLKEELTKLNEGLMHISSQQDQKLNSLSEKLNTLRKSEQYFKPEQREEIDREHHKDKQRGEPVFAIVPQHSTTYVKSQNKQIQKRKAQFNAGPIESDNSDSDKGKKKKKGKKEPKEDEQLIKGLKDVTNTFNDLINKNKLKQSYRESSKEVQMSIDGNNSVKEMDKDSKKKSASPKSLKKQESIHNIDPKESFGVMAKTFNPPRIKSELIDEFNAFEKKYNQRDHEFNNKPKEDSYFMKTL